MENDFASTFKELVNLDQNAVEAYEMAINRLKNDAYKSEFVKFKEEHQQHIEAIITILKNHGISEHFNSSIGKKQLLPKGKAVITNLTRDNSILLAIISNEIDIIDAYSFVYSKASRWKDTEDILKHIIDDEKRHKTWLENIMVQQQ